MGDLVLLAASLVGLAVEPIGADEVEHHVMVRRHFLCRQLQEQLHERGRGDVQCVYELSRAFDVRFARANV